MSQRNNPTSRAQPPMEFVIRPGRMLRALLGAIGVLLLSHITVTLLYPGFGERRVFKFILPLFHFDREANLPTLFSTLLLILASVHLAFAAVAHKRQKEPYQAWLGLALVFAFLGLDETAQIHELFAYPVGLWLNTSRFGWFGWVIPYLFGLALLALLYIPFLYRLPSSTRWRFLASGVVYVGGAVGCEVLLGEFSRIYGEIELVSIAFLTVEETLEMLGVSFFIYSIQLYLLHHFSNFAVRLQEDSQNHSAPPASKS